MNTYLVDYQLSTGERHFLEVQASNIHTAIKKVLYPMGFRTRTVAIRKGEYMTVRVERIR